MAGEIILIDNQKEVSLPIFHALKAEGFDHVSNYLTIDRYMDQYLGDDGPSCLVVTHEMPGMSGLNFLRKVRQEQTRLPRDVPFILCAFITDKNLIVAARDSGVNEICAKPIVPKNLIAKVHLTLSQPRGFILADRYAGPDRRRRSKDIRSWGLERRGG